MASSLAPPLPPRPPQHEDPDMYQCIEPDYQIAVSRQDRGKRGWGGVCQIPEGCSRSVFVRVLSSTGLGRANIDIGVGILGLGKETSSLEILLIILPQRLGLLLLTEAHVDEDGDQLTAQASCRVERERRGERKTGADGRGEVSRRRGRRRHTGRPRKDDGHQKSLYAFAHQWYTQLARFIFSNLA